jgi:hypothetical protein
MSIYEANAALIVPVAAAFVFLPGLVGATVADKLALPPGHPAVVVMLALVLLFGATAQGALTRIALGVPGTVAAALADGARLAGRVLLLQLMSAAAVLLGLALFIAPGVYLAVRLAPALPAMISEDVPPWTAAARAWSLSSRQFGPAFLLIGLIAVFGATVFLVALLVAQALPAALAQAGLADIGMFAGEAGLQWVTTATGVVLLVAQVALYRFLRRAEPS